LYKLRIKELRKAKGWTQKELAEISGVRQATVSRYERNLIDSVNLELLAKIARGLDVDVDDIIQDEGKVEAAA
jgi:putative transcriptional regulator